MPVIPIRNFTRYNTDDLTTLLEAAEKHILAHGQPLKPLNRIVHLEFHDFDPDNPKDVIRKWNGKSYESEPSRKYVGKLSYRRPERVPLLVPKSLHENPLEALTATLDGQEVAPAKMVHALVHSLCSRYDWAVWKYKGSEIVLDTSALTLRIERRASEKRPISLRDRERARKALSATEESIYNLRGAMREMTRYAESMNRANEHFRTEIGVDVGRHASEICVALSNLEAIHVRSLQTALKEKMNELAGGK